MKKLLMVLSILCSAAVLDVSADICKPKGAACFNDEDCSRCAGGLHAAVNGKCTKSSDEAQDCCFLLAPGDQCTFKKDKDICGRCPNGQHDAVRGDGGYWYCKE